MREFIHQSALNLYLASVQAGFPSPADDYIERNLDLNQHLVQHPAATFFVRVSGDSMIEAGIFQNDILIVDRSLAAAHGKVVIAVIENEFTVKRLYKSKGCTKLIAENPTYPDITFEDGQSLEIWGVVQHVIHSV